MDISGRTAFALGTESFSGSRLHSKKWGETARLADTWCYYGPVEFPGYLAPGHQSSLQVFLFPLSTPRFSNQFSGSFVNGPNITHIWYIYIYLYVYILVYYNVYAYYEIRDYFFFLNRRHSLFSCRPAFVSYYCSGAPFFLMIFKSGAITSAVFIFLYGQLLYDPYFRNSILFRNIIVLNLDFFLIK